MRKIRDFGELERYRRAGGKRVGDTRGRPSLFFDIVRVLAALICLPLLITFVITFLSGIANPGNIIGSVICVIVILLAIFYPILYKYDAARTIMRIAGGIISAFFVYAAVISALIVSGMKNEPDFAVPAGSFGEPTHTVIVLGCQTINGRPSLMLQSRLDKAVEYADEHKDCVIVLTGGKGTREVESEADTMYKYMLENGISPDRLYIENRSTNTRENLVFSEEIIKKYDLPRKVVVISEMYHVYRGTLQARIAGLTANAVYSDSSRTIYALPTYWVREIFAISRDFVYILFGI